MAGSADGARPKEATKPPFRLGFDAGIQEIYLDIFVDAKSPLNSFFIVFRYLALVLPRNLPFN